MNGISSPGVGSGLPIQDLVTQLVTAETQAQVNRITRLNARYNTELSILGKIKSGLAGLQSKMASLSDLNQFYGFSTSSSDSSYVTASSNINAVAGSYQVEVQQLAAKQSLASQSIADPSATLGSGTLTIDFGTYDAGKTTFTPNADEDSVIINIAPGSDDLFSIRDAINDSNSGVTASIVSDSQGARLTITSKASGEDLSMRITVSDNDGNNTDNAGLSQLAYDPVNTVQNMSESVTAANSKVRINGLLLEQSSNTLSDAIEGITFTLKKAEIGKIVDITVSHDTNKLKNAVGEFVNKYNETISLLHEYTGYNAETKEGGYFQSDTSLRTLKSALSNLIGQTIDTGGPLQTLADIGIKTKANGLLELNDSQFTKQLEDNYEYIGALFSRTATTTDNGLRVNTIGKDVKAGTYNITIDTYTPGSELTGTIGGVYANSTDGKVLNGTGDFKGLSIEVLSGSTGSRGQITVRDGIAIQFDQLIESYLSKDGTLTQKTDAITKRQEKLTVDQTNLDARAQKLQQRYLDQFIALDTLISQLQSTSSFLTQQLGNLPQFNSGGNN
ncbi:flagellar filament capping protein FliD [Legionella sp. W05-934-2]|jgi:flagellar hook-associated protein 2|uniref:flagellar filament capping protein FliD n=1 Tax=Legionella sp. W05-934-2 TaxID=1198649 RepID=UPI003462DC41